MSYEMWAWLVTEADGSEGIIAVTVPGLIPLPLHSRHRDIADGVLRTAAEAHARMTGRPVRLVHLVEASEGDTQ